MKKFFIFLFITLLTTAVSSQVYQGSRAQALIPGADLVIIDTTLKTPSFISFAKGSEVDYKQVIPWISNHINISSDFGWVLTRSEKDDLGYIHYRYQQTYKGYPIHSNTFIFHVKDGYVRTMNGQLFNNLDAPAEIKLNEQQALDKAIDYVGANAYMWQDQGEEKMLKHNLNNENATYYPKGELVMISSDPNSKSADYHLAYKYDIYASKPVSRQWVFVDAFSGKIIRTLQRIHSGEAKLLSNATGSATTTYSGTRTIITDYTGSTYRLRETGRGNGIETYDMNTGTSYTSSVDFTDADNNWTGTNTYMDEVARDAHWGAEMTYDYYYNKHGRNSIDNAGFKLLSYVHYDVGYVNAFWDGTRMTYGDGDNTHSPLTTLDICGHEITHGLTENTANLDYSYESGALNEGFSDIFGTSIEFYAKPPSQSGNWTIGEEIGAAFRSMSNPNLYDQPDTYHGTSWFTGTSDNGGVHYNSGVINFWYYLLCQGGSGTNDNGNAYNVSGITMAKAERIAFRTLTVYLTNSSQYSDTRTAAIQAALDLYGPCSQEVQSTTNAWYAVGVGSAYVFAPTDAEFSSSTGGTCAGAPQTIQFNNLSVNASTYLWNFGDGTTSTLASPSHNYTANGVYSVKLIASGGDCGTDSILKTAYIIVGIMAPGDTVCRPGNTTLNAVGAGTIDWYNTATGGTLLGTGSSYTTPPLSSTTTYYVQNTVDGGITYTARTNKTSTGATNITAQQGLIFTAYQAFVLKSVKIYSNASGTNSRTFSLLNSSGGTISSVTVSVPNGESRVTLNLSVPVGTNMKLVAPANSYLWRDASSADNIYPFTVPGVLSITTSTASQTPLRYYYYFYDWEVDLPDCTSPRSSVTVTVFSQPSANFNSTINDATFIFTNTSTNGSSYYWDFGDGSNSTQQSPSHTYAAAGTYTVMMVVTNGSCSDTIIMNIAVQGTGYNVSGKTRYAGKAHGSTFGNYPTYNTPVYNINKVIVALKNYPSETLVAKDTSDGSGNYQFTNVPNGNYILSYDKYTADTMQWGNDISAIDVSQLKYFINSDTVYNPSLCFSMKYKEAANVDNNTAINAVDIARIKAKIGAPNTPSQNFPKGNWVALDTVITVSNANLTVNLKTICYGDYNASSSKYRDSLTTWGTAKAIPGEVIVSSDEMLMTTSTSYFELPLRYSSKMHDFSAMGLELTYPSEAYELVSASMGKGGSKNNSTKINPTLEEILSQDDDLLVTDEDGVIRVVYATTNHFDVEANDVIIRLGFRSWKTMDQGQADFSLSGTGVFGDQYGEQDDDAFLIMPRVFVQGGQTDVGFELTGYPNPFSGNATINYSIPENGMVTLKVYNARGEVVAVLLNENQVSGMHTLVYSPKGLSAGMYTFKLEFTTTEKSKSLILRLIH